MAILVTNQSHFKPMSFEEILKPYQIMTEEYNKREAEIAALDTKAETMRQYAQQEIDAAKLENRQPASFATQYMNYANSLDKAAEDLATKGLRGTNRKTIYDLTNQYQTNVVPIETAVNTLNKLSEEQRKLGPKYLFDNNYSSGNISIQDLIDNPNMGYRAVSRDELYQKGADAAKAESVRNVINNPAVKDLANQYFKIVNTVGYDSAEAQAFMENMKTIPGLEQAFNGIRKSAGVESLDLNNQSIADSEILNGMFAGLNYKETIDYKKDEAYSMALQDYYRQQAETRDLLNYMEKEKIKKYYDNIKQLDVGTKMNINPTGASGEVNKEALKILEGFREDASGIHTAETDAADATVNNLYNQLDNLINGHSIWRKTHEETYTQEDIDLVSSIYEKHKAPSDKIVSEGLLFNTKAPKTWGIYDVPLRLQGLYREYSNLKDAIAEAEARRDESYNALQQYVSKYKHLGDTDAENIKTGASLERKQSEQQDFTATLRFEKATDRTMALEHVRNSISSLNNDSESGMYRTKKKKKKKKIDAKSAMALLNDPNANIGIYRNKDGVQLRLFTGDNEEYTFKGVGNMEDIEKTISKVDKFLKGFSAEEVDAKNLGLPKGPTLYDSSKEIVQYNPKRLEGTDYYYDIAYDINTKSWEKVLINPKTMLPIEGSRNTLQHELLGASNRDAIIGDLIEKALLSTL